MPSRIVDAVDNTNTVQLKGNVHPLARAANDRGALPDSQPLTHMLLVLQRSAQQETSLRQLLDAQVTKNSGSYHNWLTPAQFGAQFGPSDSDVAAVITWLTQQGFQIRQVAAGKTVVEFDGNVGQVRNAFHTEIHRFVANGKEHFANVSNPSIPAAIAPVVAGVAALHNFEKHSYVSRNGLYRRFKNSGQLQPLFTFGNPANYALGPQDFATIYNIPQTSNVTGAGQTIAIMADSNINLQDVADFRAMFKLPAYLSGCTPPAPCVTVVVNGVDPGIQGPDSTTDDEIEADLDTQWAGAVAPSASILLVVSQTLQANAGTNDSGAGQVSQGVDLSALYTVDNNLAPIISDSFGLCEPFLLSAGNQFYSSLWEQAAAQGITVAVATGDTGSAACDPNTEVDPFAATNGVAVNGLASTPFNVAVGGTDFDPSTKGSSVYWAQNTSGDVISSALKYIPETTWDDSACALNYPSACDSVDQTESADISAGSGGTSNCVSGTENSSSGLITCASSGTFPNGGYAKPAFQTSLTPADSVRDIPDVAFFASNGGPLATGTGVAYVVCESDSNPQDSTTPTGASCNISTPYQDFTLVGGTSAATPAFAAVMALVNQANGGERQGNANYVLYNLAATSGSYTTSACQSSVGQTPAAGCVFNDVSKGNDTVACDASSPNCSNTAAVAGAYGVLLCTPTSISGGTTCSALDNGTPAFNALAKYDLATGLGSINIGNLLTAWTTATRLPSTTTVTGVSGSNSVSTFTATVDVTGSGTAPTGDVSLLFLDGSGNVLGTVGPYTLSGGSASVSTTLPAVGAVSVEATYGGNVTYAVSTSAPAPIGTTIGGAGLTAKTVVNFLSQSPSTGGTSAPTQSAQNFPYGQPYILQIVVGNSSGSTCTFGPPNTKPTNPAIPCPTGTITLLDNGSPLNDFSNGTTNVTKVNNIGIVEDQPINLSATIGSTTPGVHKITATYSGDSNYAAGPVSNTMQITIQQAKTTTQVASSLSSVTSGQTVTLTALISPNTFSNGNAPCGTGSTGTVAFTDNGATLPGTVSYTPTPGQNSQNGASCTAMLSAAISAVYPPPTGTPGTPAIPCIPVIVALLSLLFFLLSLRCIPQARRRAYAYAGLLVIALMVGVIAGCGGGGGGGSGGGTTRTIGATYSGDANYAGSAATITVVVQ
jgi:Pro-kumamolisin, activation domain/Bacterial Ig-like domain (group 3)